ncbi:MAG: M48 family metallopeptidase [Caulobacter sp.]|nr:M48 family metallopeptidase [Caulobacter sp.]
MAAGSTTFDAAAETARYLATLSPEAHVRATAYTQGGHWMLLWGTLIAVAVSWLILKSGVLVKLRGRKGPWLAVLVVVPVAMLMDSLLTLPWNIYGDWWRQKQYGLTSQPLPEWLTEWGMGMLIGLVMSLILLGVIYALIRRAPKRWWLWSGLATSLFLIFAIVIAPVLIEPLFNKFTPAPPGPVRDAVVEMARANGVPSDKIFIYDGSKQSNRYTANVSGLFGTARVAMSDTMFKQGADLAEVRGVVGHEMGHYVHTHSLWFAAAFSVLAMIAFWLVDRLFPLACRLLGARGVEGLADPAGLPVLTALLAVIGLMGTPLTSSIIRIAEADADNFSLERVNEPDGLAKALVKTIEYRAATPGRLEEILFYDHPSVGWRVRNAMDWKAAHPTTPPPVLIDMPPGSPPTTTAPADPAAK